MTERGGTALVAIVGLVLVVAGCRATVAPTASPPAATPSPTITTAPSSDPTQPPSSPTAEPTTGRSTPPAPTPSPTAPASLRPTPGPWRDASSQVVVREAQLLDVAWTGRRFVAVGWGLDGGRVFVDSKDGVRWRRQRARIEGEPLRLSAGRGGVVAVGAAGGRPAVWHSSDGLRWGGPYLLPVPRLNGDTVTVTDVVADGTGWLAVGRRDAACLYRCGEEPVRAYAWTSPDGTRWRRVADQKSLKSGGMTAVARATDLFIAAGSAAGGVAIWTSPDGRAWSRVADRPIFRAGSLLSATGVAAREGHVVVVGMSGGESPGVRAWWSTDGLRWSRAAVEKAVGGQVFDVATAPDGFLAAGPSGGESCRGGIWSSTDGRSWRCIASARRFEGFGPYASAASATVEVVVGLTSKGYDEESEDGLPGAAWYRSRP